MKPGDLIQLDPAIHTRHNGFWAGRVVIVDEAKAWGVTCYAILPDGNAYYRAQTGTFEKVGALHWKPEVDSS